MSNLFMRVYSVIIGKREFKGHDFNIEFDVPFNDGKEENVAEIKIFNLSDETIATLKTNTSVVLNAGYTGNVGGILTGIVKYVETVWEGVDKVTTIEVIDSNDGWLNADLKRTYKPGTTAREILQNLLPLTGLAVGAFELPVNQVYPSGKTVKGKVKNSITVIAKDCKAKTHVTRNRIFIRAKKSGDNTGFIIDADHGLVGSPQPVEKEEEEVKDKKKKVKRSGWKVKMLLHHGITTDVRLQIKSTTANGVFRVESGTHKRSGDDYYTEFECFPD